MTKIRNKTLLPAVGNLLEMALTNAVAILNDPDCVQHIVGAAEVLVAHQRRENSANVVPGAHILQTGLDVVRGSVNAEVAHEAVAAHALSAVASAATVDSDGAAVVGQALHSVGRIKVQIILQAGLDHHVEAAVQGMTGGLEQVLGIVGLQFPSGSGSAAVGWGAKFDIDVHSAVDKLVAGRVERGLVAALDELSGNDNLVGVETHSVSLLHVVRARGLGPGVVVLELSRHKRGGPNESLVAKPSKLAQLERVVGGAGEPGELLAQISLGHAILPRVGKRPASPILPLLVHASAAAGSNIG